MFVVFEDEEEEIGEVYLKQTRNGRLSKRFRQGRGQAGEKVAGSV